MGGAVAGIVGGVVSGAGSLFGADAAATASENATRAQMAANQQAQEMNWLMYQQGREDIAPWRTAGYGALNELSQLYGLGAVAPSGQASLAGMPAMPNVDYDSGGGMWDALSTFGDPAGILPDFMDPAGIMADKARARNTSPSGQQSAPAGVATAAPSGGGMSEAEYKKKLRRLQDDMRSAKMYLDEGGESPADVQAKIDSLNKLYNTPAPVAAAPVQQAPQMTPEQIAAQRKAQQQGALSRFQTSPGYSFRLNQGIQALDRSAAARGRLLSGGQIKGVQRFGEGMAADEYNTYTNRLASLAGLGQTSAGQSAGLAQSAGQAGSNIAMQGGADRASGYINQANAWNQGIQGVGNAFNATLQNYQQQQYMNQMQKQMQG